MRVLVRLKPQLGAQLNLARGGCCCVITPPVGDTFDVNGVSVGAVAYTTGFGVERFV